MVEGGKDVALLEGGQPHLHAENRSFTVIFYLNVRLH